VALSMQAVVMALVGLLVSWDLSLIVGAVLAVNALLVAWQWSRAIEIDAHGVHVKYYGLTAPASYPPDLIEQARVTRLTRSERAGARFAAIHRGQDRDGIELVLRGKGSVFLATKSPEAFLAALGRCSPNTILPGKRGFDSTRRLTAPMTRALYFSWTLSTLGGLWFFGDVPAVLIGSAMTFVAIIAFSLIVGSKRVALGV
jgi:hypothetical protein